MDIQFYFLNKPNISNITLKKEYTYRNLNSEQAKREGKGLGLNLDWSSWKGKGRKHSIQKELHVEKEAFHAEGINSMWKSKYEKQETTMTGKENQGGLCYRR